MPAGAKSRRWILWQRAQVGKWRRIQAPRQRPSRQRSSLLSGKVPVTNCGTEPKLQEPIKDPARFEWHEVTKVAHYYLSVDALTRPMQVREESAPYGGAE